MFSITKEEFLGSKGNSVVNDSFIREIAAQQAKFTIISQSHFIAVKLNNPYFKYLKKGKKFVV